MATKYETILVEKDAGITWVMFNRPDKRNAIARSCTTKWTMR